MKKYLENPLGFVLSVCLFRKYCECGRSKKEVHVFWEDWTRVSTLPPLPCTFPYAEGSTETRLNAGKAVAGALESLFCLVGFFVFFCVFWKGLVVAVGSTPSSPVTPTLPISSPFPGKDWVTGTCLLCDCFIIQENTILDDCVAKYSCKRRRNCLFSVCKTIFKLQICFLNLLSSTRVFVPLLAG